VCISTSLKLVDAIDHTELTDLVELTDSIFFGGLKAFPYLHEIIPPIPLTLIPNCMSEFGAMSLIPPLVVVVAALWMRRSLEPLILGCLVGYGMIAWRTPNEEASNVLGVKNVFFDTIDNFIAGLYKVMTDEANVWVILVCGFLGSVIYLLINSGSIYAFGDWATKYVKSRKSALLMSWILGVIIFIDDYMSALAVGNTMRKITDKYKISREMLSFMVNSMAAPLCLIVPLSTWTVFVGGLLEENKIVSEGDGLGGYWETIPFMFYGWVIVFIALGVAMGWIPLLGKMKKAEMRAAATGQTSPDGSPLSEIQTMGKNTTHWHFILPIVVLIAATLFFDNDALKGAIVCIIFTIVYYMISKVQPFNEMGDGVWAGFNTMVFALAILMASYVLKEVNAAMGLTEYVIEGVKPYISSHYLPVIVFLSMGVIAVLTASNWGLYAVAIPIVVPLAQSIGADVWLTIAALVSAGGVGSQLCFYSDTCVLTTTSTECESQEMMWAQMPYVLAAAVISSVLFIAAAYMV
jgi:tetracycline resistance efflux pump